MKYKCPCCGYYTYNEKTSGTYDICKVCFGEDDPGLKAWSNGNSGLHFTIFYSLIFFIPSVVLGVKYKKYFGATLGKIVSFIICILLVLMLFFGNIKL